MHRGRNPKFIKEEEEEKCFRSFSSFFLSVFVGLAEDDEVEEEAVNNERTRAKMFPPSSASSSSGVVSSRVERV